MKVLQGIAGAIAICLSASTAFAASNSIEDFSPSKTQFHNPVDVEKPIEVSVDKGLTVDLIVQCKRSSGAVISGMMIYSKLDRKYCSSKHQCFDAFEPAHFDTCS